jgi:hypothetical protein
MNVASGDFSHPSWTTAFGTFVSYALVLVAMFVLLFVVPFGLFRFL